MNNSEILRRKAASMSFGGRGKDPSSVGNVTNFYKISDIHTISITSFDKVEDVNNKKIPKKNCFYRTGKNITCTGSVFQQNRSSIKFRGDTKNSTNFTVF